MAKFETKAKLVTLPANGVTYTYKFEIAGKSYTGSTGCQDYESARAYAVKLRQEAILKNMMRARNLMPGAKRDLPIVDAVDQYWELHGQHVIAADLEKPYLAMLVQMLGPKTLVSKIDRYAILKFLNELRVWVSPITKRVPMPGSINSRLRLLRRVLIFARDTLEIETCKLRWKDFWLEEDQRDRTLSIEEQNLMDDGSAYATVMRFFIACGPRKRALLNLTWDRVHLDRREFELPKKRSGRKNGTARPKNYTVHMTDQMVEIIKAQLPFRDAGQGKVWTVAANKTAYNNFAGRMLVRGQRKPMAVSAFDGWYTRRARKLGLDITVHDLRRTCGDEMLRATDGGIAYVQKALDHHSPEVTMRAYAKVLGTDMRGAFEKTAAFREVEAAKLVTVKQPNAPPASRMKRAATATKRKAPRRLAPLNNIEKAKKNRRSA